MNLKSNLQTPYVGSRYPACAFQVLEFWTGVLVSKDVYDQAGCRSGVTLLTWAHKTQALCALLLASECSR